MQSFNDTLVYVDKMKSYPSIQFIVIGVVHLNFQKPITLIMLGTFHFRPILLALVEGVI